MTKLQRLKSFRERCKATISEFSPEFERVRQLPLLRAEKLISFCKKIGISTSLYPSALERCVESGLLGRDSCDPDGKSLFHKFRVLEIQAFEHSCNPALEIPENISLQSLSRRQFIAIVTNPNYYTYDSNDSNLHLLHKMASFTEVSVLLEPLYWPIISNRIRMPVGLNVSEYYRLRQQIHNPALSFVRTFPLEHWKKVHMDVCSKAYFLD